MSRTDGRRRPSSMVLVALTLGVSGCGWHDRDAKPAGQDDRAAATGLRLPAFTDVLAASHIKFRHHFLDSETGSNYRISPYDHGSGVCVADFNGDGLDDIYFLDFLGPNHLYLNRGRFTFEDVTAASGVGMGRSISVGASAGDYDNDGDQDLYVTSYRGGNHLFRNRGDATFEDVTETARVGHVGHSCGAAWFDYDLDGDLDLYLVNIGRFTKETISQEAAFAYEGVQLAFEEFAERPDLTNPGEPNVLWRNEGDGTFTDVTRRVGLTAGEWNADMAVADIDLDGDPDLYVSNMFGPNHLFLNRGNGTFEERTASSLKRTSWGAMGCKFFDGNGDAYPDLLVVDMHSDMWIEPEAVGMVKAGAKYDSPLGPSRGKVIDSAEQTKAGTVLFGNTYFVNKGDGTFTEESARAGLETWWPWGVAAGDFNDDGTTDVFMPTGMGFPYFYWPNQLFLNDGRGRFHEVATRAGIEPPRAGRVIEGVEIPSYVMNGRRYRGAPFARSSRAAAVADFDLDGDLDLVVNNFNHEPYLLRNDTPGAHFLGVKLRGRSANADAFGSRVVVEAGGRSWSQQLNPGGGYLAQGSSVLHFGLGQIAFVSRLAIHWPGRNPPQVIENPGVDRVIFVRQE